MENEGGNFLSCKTYMENVGGILYFRVAAKRTPDPNGEARDKVFYFSNQSCSTLSGLWETLEIPCPRASPGVIDGLSPLGYAVRSNRDLAPERAFISSAPGFSSLPRVRSEKSYFFSSLQALSFRRRRNLLIRQWLIGTMM